MTKKGKKDASEEMCVIFVEGDADELIINRLLDYYKSNGWSRPKGIRVFNTHGTPIWRNMRVGLVTIQQCQNTPVISERCVVNSTRMCMPVALKQSRIGKRSRKS